MWGGNVYAQPFSCYDVQMFNKMPYKPPSKILVGPFLDLTTFPVRPMSSSMGWAASTAWYGIACMVRSEAHLLQRSPEFPWLPMNFKFKNELMCNHYGPFIINIYIFFFTMATPYTEKTKRVIFLTRNWGRAPEAPVFLKYFILLLGLMSVEVLIAFLVGTNGFSEAQYMACTTSLVPSISMVDSVTCLPSISIVDSVTCLPSISMVDSVTCLRYTTQHQHG